jgi:branched-chain amino acid transport system substrate-binding protein
MRPSIINTWFGGAIAALAVSALVFSGCMKKEEKAGREEKKEIRIGATLPLTGDAAVWGKNTQEGIDLALGEINAGGGILGRKLSIVYEDTKAAPSEGVSAYRKLTSISKVKVIIDDSVSGVTLAMAPLAQKDHVVVLSTGATAPKISEAGEYIFRIWNSDAYEGEVSADYAFDTLGLRSVSTLYINNDYGSGLEQVFTTRFTGRGGKIQLSESFEQNTADMRTQLAKIQAGKPEALYLVGYPKEIPIALRQARELGMTMPFLGTVAMQDPQLIQSAGYSAEGLIFPYPKDSAGQDAAVFKSSFHKKYAKEPGITADVGYDAVNMIAKAMEISGGTGGEDIVKGLNLLKAYPGASGVMTFDQNGDVHKPMGLKTVSKGQFVWRE